MSHIKFIAPSGWDFDRHIAVPIKVSSRGLIGNDRREFLKTASASFLPWLGQAKFASDEQPIHLIALGASDSYGSNRNGDAFEADVCRKYHDTFTKFAQFFRNHKNKPEKGDPSFGKVAASTFNEQMQRVELVCALNAEKSAADRNGGLVADQEMAKLAAGKDLPVSMACNVPFDICSFCKHAAATRADYCTASTCGAGGCFDNLSRVVKVGGDLHHLHVRNTLPTWFDISGVVRPADRIAYGARADYLTKAAADNGLADIQSTMKAAAAATAPLAVLLHNSCAGGQFNEKMAVQLRLGYGLAQLEQHERSCPDVALLAFNTAPFPIEKLAKYGTSECYSQLAAMADRKVVLPLRDYARLAGQTENVKAATSLLPRLYSELTFADELAHRLERGVHPLLDKVAGVNSRTIAAGFVTGYSVNPEAAASRAMLGSLNNSVVSRLKLEKSASADGSGVKLAQDYAAYQLAALHRIAETDNDFPLTVRLILRQNQTC